MKFDNIKGTVVGVSNIERESCCDLSVRTKDRGIVNLHLSTGRMGLGRVDPDGRTGTVVQQFDKSTGDWLPTSFSNPRRFVGMNVSVEGNFNDDVRGIRVDEVRSFKIT